MGLWATAVPRIACADGLTALAANSGQIRVDGSLREWPSKALVDLPGAGDTTKVALAYDADALYLAAEVGDAEVSRRDRAPSARDDALVLTLSLPDGKRSEVWLHPGLDSVAAAGRIGKGGADARIEVVEGPRARGPGYVLEARVPWSLVPGAQNRHLARVAVRLHDVDGGRPSTQAPRLKLGELVLEGGHGAALHALLAEHDVSNMRPTLDGAADVAGDTRLERVLVVGDLLVIVAADVPMRYLSLPVVTASDVVEARLSPLLGGGRSALLLTARHRAPFGVRQVLRVYRFEEHEPSVPLAIEVAREAGGKRVQSRVSLRKGEGRRRVLVLQPDAAPTLSGAVLQEPAPGGVQPILRPDGPVARVTYAWDGARFTRTVEDNPDYSPPEVPAAPVARPAPMTASQEGPRQTGDLVEAFIARQGLGDVARRFETTCNVAEDRQVETVVVLGTQLLVTGQRFAGGNGFFFFDLPVKSPQDVLHVFTSDVTGDGRGEIFVRLREHIGEVERDVLRAFTFTDSGFQEILATEVRRAIGADRVENRVRVVPARGRHTLRLEPGRAYGWTAQTYPFLREEQGAYDALLLPFRDGPASYVYEGGRLVRR